MSATITFYIKNKQNILIKTLLIPKTIATKHELICYLNDIHFINSMNYDLYHGNKLLDNDIPSNVFESSLKLVEKYLG